MSQENDKIEDLDLTIPASDVRTLETDILAFTETLPYWAKYLSECLLSGAAPSEADYDEAVKYFLEDAGLLPKPETRPSINIICKQVTGNYHEKLVLSKISNIEGINALVPNQVMEFGKNLTIVFGSNGSGKSGYIRLLNNSFITKGEKSILSNINEDSPAEKKAEFEFATPENAFTRVFPGDCSHAEFKQFSVFDEVSVHAHLNNKNKFEFRPAGLSYFSAISDSCKKVEDMVHNEISLHSQNPDLQALFDGDSPIKTLLTQLSEKSKIDFFDSYNTFEDSDQAKRKELEEQKAALMALKKDKEISDLEQVTTQLNGLKTKLVDANKYFTASQLSKACELIKDFVAKDAIAKSDNIEKFAHDKLIGIGDDQWRAFLLAAQQFAKIQGAPPGGYPTNEDICILCHQPLSKEAVELINSYWAFIQSKAEQDAKDADFALAKASFAYEKLDLNLIPESSFLHKWLSENHEQTKIALESSLQKQVVLKKEVLMQIENRIPAPTEDHQIDTIVIDNVIAEIDKRIKTLKVSEVSEQIAEIQGQIIFLNHKEKLVTHYESVKKVIDNLSWVSKAAKAKSKIPKRVITEKEKDLSDIYFNQAYVDKFRQECETLNGDFGVKINHSGSAGTSFRQLTLKGNAPTDILSEGEQKVISLADFLAETILSGVNKGMIFDDPVTSLDNDRKGSIAKRLVKESEDRQIVVFTHDLVFVSQLIEAAKEYRVEHLCHWMEQRDGKPGYVFLRNAPSYEKDYKTADKPRAFASQASKPECAPELRDYLIQQGFTSLRTCYESLVVWGMFDGVVQRFVERVSVDSLASVTIDPDVKTELTDSFGLCCRYMEGHSHSDTYAYKKPLLEDLQVEIKRFDNLRIKINNAKKEAKKGKP